MEDMASGDGREYFQTCAWCGTFFLLAPIATTTHNLKQNRTGTPDRRMDKFPFKYGDIAMEREARLQD